jgi:hypothetical protein
VPSRHIQLRRLPRRLFLLRYNVLSEVSRKAEAGTKTDTLAKRGDQTPAATSSAPDFFTKIQEKRTACKSLS